MKQSKPLPGSIYLNNGRYWWRVILPGNDKRQAIPLKPTGSVHATQEYAVAVKVAENILSQAIFHRTPRKFDGKVAGLVQAYLNHCRSHYRKSNEPRNIESGLSLLVKRYGNEQVEDFGPLKLKAVRDKMIESRLSRSTINKRVGMVKRCFSWGVENELIHESTANALNKLQNLQAGRSDAKETEPVRPVDLRVFNAVVDHAGPVVCDMMRIQLLTGMRSSELCSMRPVDIETKGKVWFYTPVEHKTAYKGKIRVIAIGPQAQVILKPYLDRKVDSYCFSPKEAVKQMFDNRRAARKTPLGYGNAPGTNRKADPQVVIGDHYNKDNYNRAVTRAIRRAQKVRENELAQTMPLKDAKVKTACQIPHFSPHQLRHTAATIARQEFGLDAAAALLGHSNVKVTQVYAEIQSAKAAQVAGKIG